MRDLVDFYQMKDGLPTSQSTLDSPSAPYAMPLLTAVFWGGTFIAGRVLTEHAGPFAGSFLRFAVAGVLLVLVTLQTMLLLGPVLGVKLW